MNLFDKDKLKEYCSELEKSCRDTGNIEPLMTVCADSKGLVYLFGKPGLSTMQRLDIMKQGFMTMASDAQAEATAIRNAKKIDANKLRKES